MSGSDPSPETKEHFIAFLDRMLNPGDDFELCEDDIQVLRAVADSRNAPPTGNDDILNAFYCKQLDIPPGSVYREAARKVSQRLGLE